MESFEASFKRDREIISHVRWASGQIKIISKRIFEEVYSSQFPNAKFLSEAIPDKGTYKSFTTSYRLTKPFTKYDITSSLHLKISVEEEGYIQELKEDSGILFHIFFGKNLPTYWALIEPRPLRDEEGVYDRSTEGTKRPKRIRPDGWKRRGWDGITRILYNLNNPDSNSIFFQIAIDLIRKGFLTGYKTILKQFSKYVFNRIASSKSRINHLPPDMKELFEFGLKTNQSLPDKIVNKARKIYAQLEKEGLGQTERSNDDHFEENLNEDRNAKNIISMFQQDEQGNVYSRFFKITTPSYRPSDKHIKGQEINMAILEETLNHVVNKMSFPCLYNPTTFEVYVRLTLAGKVKDYWRNEKGIKKPSYYKRKSNPKREMRNDIITLIYNGWTLKDTPQGLKKVETGKKVNRETARKRLQRWEKKWTLDEIYYALI